MEKNEKTSVSQARLYTKSKKKVAGDFFLFAATTVAYSNRSVVTANLFRSANLFRRNLFASGSVPDFQKISGFVPGGQRSMFL